MYPHADCQAESLVLLQSRIQSPNDLNNAQPSLHCPLCIIFMCLGIAKIYQQAITEILGNMALEVLDDRSAGLLVRPHDLPQVFGIEAAGEGSRVYQVAEQHCELTAFGARWLWRRRWAIYLGDVSSQGDMRWHRRGRG